jgi:class 3 adenylate cyclase
MTRLGKRLRRRPPFSAALVGLVVVLTALTAATIGGLAWREQRAQSRALLDAALERTAQLAASNASRFLKDAESVVRIGPELVASGQLDPEDRAELERFTLSLLHAYPHLSWVSYGGVDDRFVGAWRDADGRLYLNRSFPAGGRIRLEEDRLRPDGTLEPWRRSDDHGYHPRERPYFLAAEKRRGVAWTEPYEFYAGGGLGITCAAPIMDRAGRIRGVFTVDFSLRSLTATLDALEVSPHGRVFVATRRGTVLAGTRGQDDRDATRMRDRDLVDLIAARTEGDAPAAFEFDHGRERYLGRAVPLHVGDHPWLVEVVVPERDYTEPVDAQARRAILLGLLALGLAVACGLAIARWIARPLRDLARQALRIREGHLDVTLMPRSRDEIGVLTRAMAEMARALRDRDFIRETLGRYVSPELAERCLSDRSALRLGGELRQVTILMSDLRGFSELSERLGPQAMIDLINRYLARMTPVILAHGGVIDEFIGDAILVLFGAPFERVDDAARAVRCALAMQEAVRTLNAENEALGLPELPMGIAVHSGVVVAGNIGSPDRVKYGVVGPTVNLTARLQALASGGEIVVSDAVLARAGGELRVGPAQAVQVKGFAAPVTVHRLLGVEPGATDLDEPAREAAAPREGPRRPPRGIWRRARGPRVRVIPGGTRPARPPAEGYAGLSV